MKFKDISLIIKKQKNFFYENKTKSYSFRLKQLKRLKNSIIKHEHQLIHSLHEDMRKPEFEAYTGEIGFVLQELEYTIKHLKSWMKPQTVPTPILHKPGKSVIIKEPLGTVLIMGHWNYPFHLLFAPLVAAISSGNTVVLKSSEYAPYTSKVMKDIITNTFQNNYVTLIEGDAEISKALLKEKFDHIFFTGSIETGKSVMKAASKNLTPVTLELGGKTPCIVDKEINLEIAAKRIVWGKFFNSGQTCIAPDYILADKKITNNLIKYLIREIKNFYTASPQTSKDYSRIINEKHFNRIISYIDKNKVIFGGDYDKNDLYIAPTIIKNVTFKDKIMQEEIFGPLLPIIEYDTINEAIKLINDKEKPLAIYLFSNDKNIQNKVIRQTSSGGISINDTLSHITTPYMPFGGVGLSGMGKYHGKYGFDTFSNSKSVMKKSMKIDPSLRYAPYNMSLKTIKKILRIIG